MAKGISLHIGLNAVDPNHYGGWSGVLNACEADANDMQAVAKAQKFETKVLLTKEATRSAVANAIADAATKLESGDIFLLTYSGHGGQVPDLNGDEEDDEEALDETWCFYDGEWLDDENYKAWQDFKAGVRIFVLSDSCHSGTAIKQAYGLADSTASRLASSKDDKPVATREMPDDAARRTYEKNREFYDGIAKAAKGPFDVKATVLLISGCQDNQLSQDGTFNGLFTGTLLRVWNSGKFKGSYRRFKNAIVRRMPSDQTPNYYVVGATNEAFEKQKPFKI